LECRAPSDLTRSLPLSVPHPVLKQYRER
jgi:hypothetical protein